MEVTATASYKSPTGEPRTSHCQFTLPLGLVARVVPGAGEARCKLTLDTDKEPVHIPTLYQDMAESLRLPDGSLPAANLLSFAYTSGEEVKIIASKNAGRYRIQSTSLGAMCHVAGDLTRRLEAYFAAKGGQCCFSFSESIPLPEYLECVERHHALRKDMAVRRDRLADRAQQYRSVQKRLLVRYKERNPAPVGHLDLLLQGTYDELLDLGTAYEEQQAMLKRVSGELSCATRLVLRLMAYKFQLDEENVKVLTSHWTADVDDNLEQGWEERVNSALLHLLRSTMAKAKENRPEPEPTLNQP